VEQAPEVPLLTELPDLPVPTLKHEKSLLTFFEEQCGQLMVSDESSEISSSKVFLHLEHSYSNMGKVMPPIASAITS